MDSDVWKYCGLCNQPIDPELDVAARCHPVAAMLDWPVIPLADIRRALAVEQAATR